VIKEKNKIRRLRLVKLGEGRSVVERNKGQGAKGKEDREKLRSEVIRGKREAS
jgi:hypothetical protein